VTGGVTGAVTGAVGVDTLVAVPVQAATTRTAMEAAMRDATRGDMELQEAGVEG
jgi:hypothetical protein